MIFETILKFYNTVSNFFQLSVLISSVYSVLLIYKLFCAFFLLALGAIIGGWIIVYYIIDEKYEESFKFIPWIILALYIKALYSFTIQFIYKKKKTFVLGIITFISSIIQMLLSYVLIKNLGIMGAVYSGCVAALITSVAIAIYSYIVYPMPWFSFVKNRN